jgi:hypothetical protein
MTRQKRRQADGLVAELGADGALGVRREIALVEEEVDNGVDALEPRRQGQSRRR